MASNSSTSNFKISRKTCTITAWALAFLALFSWAFSYFMQPVDENHMQASSMQRVIDAPSDYDAVFIGDSRMHAGIAPAVFAKEVEKLTGEKITAINIGRPGMQAPFIYHIFKRYLEHAKHPPKYLFINFTFYLLGEQDPFRNDFYISYYTPTLHEAWDMYKNRVVGAKQAVFWYVDTRIPLIRYRKRMNNLIDVYFADRNAFQDAMLNAKNLRDIDQNPKFFGQLPHPGKVLDPSYIYDEYRVNHAEGYDHFLAYWNRIFALAEKSNTQIVLFEYPWPTQLDTPQFNALLEQYHTLLRQKTKEYPNVRLLFDVPFWSTQYFFDQQHLNKEGSEKLSEIMAAIYAGKLNTHTATAISKHKTKAALPAARATRNQCGTVMKHADVAKAGVYYVASSKTCIWHIDEQRFSLDEAQHYCEQRGAVLCNKRQVADAQLAGMGWCPWSWVQDAPNAKNYMWMHPMQQRDDAVCGNKTVLPTAVPANAVGAGVACCLGAAH